MSDSVEMTGIDASYFDMSVTSEDFLSATIAYM
jgi:hypothetical protein